MPAADTLIFQFFLFSFFGWILEVSYRSITDKKFINAGFNRGPWVPLYGAASAVIIITSGYIADQNVFVRALVYLVITTGMEYVTGEIMLSIFRKRYWDYRDSAIHLRGHVCPTFSLAWVAACFFFEIVLLPGSVLILSHIQPVHIRAANTGLALLLTADFAWSSGLPLRAAEMGRRYGTAISERLEELPDEMGTLIFSSPRLRMARRQFTMIIKDERIKQAEEDLRRYRAITRRRGLNIIRRLKGDRT